VIRTYSFVSSTDKCLVFGDSNLGKVRQIKPAQLAFRCTINIILLTYLLKCHGAVWYILTAPSRNNLTYFLT